jgi:hypothetical protein
MVLACLITAQQLLFVYMASLRHYQAIGTVHVRQWRCEANKNTKAMQLIQKLECREMEKGKEPREKSNQDTRIT